MSRNARPDRSRVPPGCRAKPPESAEVVAGQFARNREGGRGAGGIAITATPPPFVVTCARAVRTMPPPMRSTCFETQLGSSPPLGFAPVSSVVRGAAAARGRPRRCSWRVRQEPRPRATPRAARAAGARSGGAGQRRGFAAGRAGGLGAAVTCGPERSVPAWKSYLGFAGGGAAAGRELVASGRI